MKHIVLEFRRYEDASLAHTVSNRSTASTGTGLMGSAVPMEAVMMGTICPVRGCLAEANG
ncbi:MAG: hypothetical protein J6T59_07560 [Bacteroidales bacterium]|nr:hypothetical protein [Bacteroidales bacterium]